MLGQSVCRFIKTDDRGPAILFRQMPGTHAGAAKGIKDEWRVTSLSEPGLGIIKGFSCVHGSGFTPEGGAMFGDQRLEIGVGRLLITLHRGSLRLRVFIHLAIITRLQQEF